MRRFLYILLVLVLLGGGYAGWALNKPLPTLQPTSTLGTALAPASAALPWPDYGEAAVGAVGFGTLASHGKQTPLPTASVAKTLTALAVLKKKPLQLGQSGPAITINAADVQFYRSYVAKDGSVVPVNYGEKISEYQALQGLLLASGNNLADTLAIWAFGSLPAYTDYANQLARDMGLHDTHIADASGFAPATVSTASDLVVLGEAVLKNPVLKQIVGQHQANIPVAGTIHNVNWLLGQDGISGIKTGNTDEAGGVFLAAGTYPVADSHRKVTIVVAVMGGAHLKQAMNDSVPLMKAAQTNFSEQPVVAAGDVVGYYNTPWGSSANIVATANLTSFIWKGTAPKLQLKLNPQQPPAAAGTTVGTLTLAAATDTKAQTVPVALQHPLDTPSWRWRLLHP